MFTTAPPIFLTVKHGMSCQSVMRIGLLVIIAVAMVYQAYVASQMVVLMQGLRNDTHHLIYLMEITQPMVISAHDRLGELVLVLTEPILGTPE